MAVVADPSTRLIDIDIAPVAGAVVVDIVQDIYSKLKDDWQSNANLQKVKFPFRTFGDPIGTEKIGPYVFFNNLDGWRMRPYDADHELTLRGNLIPESDVLGTFTPTWVSRPGRTIQIIRDLSTQALTAAGSTTAWTDAEKNQIRSALGVDGTKVSATGGQLQTKADVGAPMTLTTAERLAIATEVFAWGMGGGMTYKDVLDCIAAILGGVVTGGPANPKFYKMGDPSKLLIQMMADKSGNRSSIQYTP